MVHENNYRDKATGFHTNDAESENNRLKSWNRQRYSKLLLDEHELQEYVYYINLGDTMSLVMEGLAASNGGVVRNLKVQ